MLLNIVLILQLVSAQPDTTEGYLSFNLQQTGFDRVTSLHATPAGEVFLVESGRHRLVKLSLTGERLDSLGRRGSGDYSFNNPVSVDATNGMRIYVADKNNRRIQTYDRRLQFLGSLLPPERAGFNELFFNPEKVAVNKFGEVYVYDRETEKILKYDQNGRFVLFVDLRGLEIALPIGSMSHFEDSLFLSESGRNVLHEITTGGGYRGFVFTPGIILDMFTSESAIWAVTRNRVLQFSHSGRLIASWKHDISGIPTAITAVGQHLIISTSDSILSARKPTQ